MYESKWTKNRVWERRPQSSIGERHFCFPPINSAGKWKSSVPRYQVAFRKNPYLKHPGHCTAPCFCSLHAANMGIKQRREIPRQFPGLCKLRLIKCHRGVLLPAKQRICVFIHITGMPCRKLPELTRWNRRPQKIPFQACDLNKQLGVFCIYPSGGLGTSQCLKGAYRKVVEELFYKGM